ncbi:MAG: hypothetical protein M5U12_16780 [Verrucomicrobia bacterium]|nr:hypothetical protein [Verrucomicrobiota bacterium]
MTRDFREFLQCLNAHAVEYLVIGGHAVAYHGYPRATADLDVWVAVNRTNAGRLVSALSAFGFAVPELTPDLFLREERIIRMGIAPNRIEIQTGIDGVRFTECFPRRGFRRPGRGAGPLHWPRRPEGQQARQRKI